MRSVLPPEARRDCKQRDKAWRQSVVRVRGSTGNIDGGTVAQQATMSTDRTQHRR